MAAAICDHVATVLIFKKGNMMRTVEIKQLTLEHCLGLGASSSVQLKIQVTCSLPLLLLLLLSRFSHVRLCATP